MPRYLNNNSGKYIVQTAQEPQPGEFYLRMSSTQQIFVLLARERNAFLSFQPGTRRALTLVHILVHTDFVMEYNVHEAKTHFSRLLQKVAAGEEVTIARDGVPVARLVPVEAALTPRKLGLYSGKIWMADDFDAPLAPDLLAGFHGEESPVKKTKKKKK